MAIEIRKAERFKSKLRLGLAGPSGAGKTMSSLKLARGIAQGKRVLMIDTERGSGDLYADLFEYDIITLKPPYAPKNYIDAIKAGEEAGYEVIIIDSLSHAWTDEGGLLDQVEKKGGSSFNAWKDITPQHRALVNAMLNSPCHLIATMRSKQAYEMEEYTDSKGNKKSRPVKMGMAPVQREGMEYEFTIFMDINQEHFATTTKDRTNMFKDEVFTIDEKVGERILQWLNSGRENPALVLQEKKATIWGLMKELGLSPKSADEAKTLMQESYKLELVEANYDQIIEKLKTHRNKRLQEAVEKKKAEQPQPQQEIKNEV